MVSSTAVVLLQVILVSSAFVTSAVPSDRAEKKPEPAVTADPIDAPATTATSPPPTPSREPKDVSILKQINKVNDDGSYTFGYEASDGSFKVETRDVAGNVKGMFGFVDEAGRLKRVSYSASNSSGFHAAGSTSTSPLDSSAPTSSSPSSSSSIQTIPPRRYGEGHAAEEPRSGVRSAATTTGVKKVLVSKRLVQARDDETERRRRGGNDPRRQLPRNDDGDAPDVYGGVHGRSSMESGPVSPVVSALMSELELVPVRAYRPSTEPAPPPTALPATDAYDDGEGGATYAPRDAISRRAQEDDDPQYRPVTVQYRRPQPAAGVYHQQQSALPTVVYQQQQPVAYPTAAAYGPNLAAFRDELMELILTFVQARISQLVSLAPLPYANQPAPPPSYPMPYQQPNYYVPNYYQGPRIPVSSRRPTDSGFVLQQLQQSARQSQDDYVTAAAAAVSDAPQQSSPRVTQTLKDGLIRMLLSTSPRYDPDRNREWSTPSATFRRTTQSTPVRSVQIVDDNADSRPVTTESPD